MIPRCPVCGDILRVDEEWRAKPGVPMGKPVEDGDYIHERCVEEYLRGETA